MKKGTSTDADILRILSMSLTSTKKSKPEELLQRAMEGGPMKKAPPAESYITHHFMIRKGRRVMSNVKYKWLDDKDQPLPVHGPFATNDKGWGMFCIKESDFRKLDNCKLVIVEKNTGVSIPNIPLNKIDLYSRFNGNGYSIRFTEHPDLVNSKKSKRKSPFSIAVSGDSKQLNEAIPRLKKQACIKVSKVFADAKEIKKVKVLDPQIRIETTSKDISKKLSGIDILLDLSDNPVITQLSQSQIFGKRKMKTIIVPDGARFKGMEEEILSYFNTKPTSIPNWEKIVKQLQKTKKK